jgi:hypothetical protein
MRKIPFLVFIIIFICDYSFSQACLPEGITFQSQDEIDNFQVNYPGCTRIDGDVFIMSDNITNLNGLNVIDHIGGMLVINYCSGLSDLSGLECLVGIGNDLIILGNDELENLDGLGNLASIGDRLEISNNPSLTSLSGLSNLAFNSIKDLYLRDNLSLSTCNEPFICDYLADPPGSVNIYHNSAGCNNPAELALACDSAISCLPFGNYYFLSQNDVDRFQSDFPGCEDLHGNVKIGGTDISNLDGLNGINSIEGHLEIFDNSILSNLFGLENLISIKIILIVNNQFLTTLSGLDNINPDSMNTLVISNNGVLSDCDVQGICDYIASPESYADIYSNTADCNSRDEVLAACEVGTPDYQMKSICNLFPDPVSSFAIFHLQISDPGHIKIFIYNNIGQLLETIADEYLPAGNHFISWNARNLSPGLYFYRISNNDNRQSITGKIIKN